MVDMFDLAGNFNQCLSSSSWADKTQTNVNFNVNLNGIFTDSGCPNKDTVATVGPWCLGFDEQCYAQPKDNDCTGLHDDPFSSGSGCSGVGNVSVPCCIGLEMKLKDWDDDGKLCYQWEKEASGTSSLTGILIGAMTTASIAKQKKKSKKSKK